MTASHALRVTGTEPVRAARRPGLDFLTMTDAHGDEVTNPVFEFDGCFDPNSDNSSTGVVFPSLLNITSPTLTPDADGRVSCRSPAVPATAAAPAR